MANYLTSDTHFGHKVVIKYDGGHFDSIEDHDRTIISNINDTLKPGDVLWHLGDVAWDFASLQWFFLNLRDKVQVRLIRGNHDDRVAWKHRQQFFHTADEALYTKIEGHKFYLSHYAHRVWRNSHHGSFHAFGHSHGSLAGIGRSIDVGIMNTGYAPISVTEVVAKLSVLPVTNHHPVGD